MPPHRPSQALLRRRAWLYQGLLVLMLVTLLAALWHNTLDNLRARGIQSGFDFLQDMTGFDIGESMLDYDSSQPYWRAFLVGLLNTLRVTLVGVLACTVLGFTLGLMRLSAHPIARGLASAWIELFRNIPLLLQLFFWYALLLDVLPEMDAPVHWHGWCYLSKSGLVLPGWLWSPEGLTWEYPYWEDGAAHNGLTLSPEFLTLCWGLSLYTAAFVAELVRAGFTAVAASQTEAALSLGMTRAQAQRWVVLPQALRIIVPPLTNQYLNLSKNASLAVAIGYPDLVSIANTTLNQTGRAVECIGVILGVYLVLSLITAAAMNLYHRRLLRSSRA